MTDVSYIDKENAEELSMVLRATLEWHWRVLSNVLQICEIPVGQEIEVKFDANSEAEKFVLTEETRKLFCAGVIAAAGVFDTLPFSVSNEGVSDGALH